MIPRLLLALSVSTVLAAQPADFAVRIDAGPYDAQQRADVTVEVTTIVPLANPELLELDIHTLDGISLASWSTGEGIACTELIPTFLRCRIEPLAAGRKTTVNMRVHTNRGSAAANVTADLRWRDRGFVAEHRSWRTDLYRYERELVVTNADDTGAGSLRQAIVDANATCVEFRGPCLIRFDIGENAVVFPRTPLPAITGRGQIVIEGPVTLDGSLVDRPANGLIVTEFGTAVLREVTIQRFPENGFEIARSHASRVESCVLTGNRSRGMTVLDGTVSVVDSVVNDNGRSGVFVDGGSAAIVRSRIEDNGASGVFAGRTTGVWLRDNVIAGNAHFGIATIPENRDVDVARNRIAGNHLGQIDIGLDGPSRFVEADPGKFLPPNGPTFHSATYDPATGTTTVRGRLEPTSFHQYLTYELHFYATTAANDAEEYLGGIHITRADFTFTVPGDLRGRFVTANTIFWLEFPGELTDRTTSELSAPIEVR